MVHFLKARVGTFADRFDPTNCCQTVVKIDEIVADIQDRPSM